jgi:hypothetical protein
LGASCEIIAPETLPNPAGISNTQVLLETIRRRPLSVSDIIAMFGMREDRVLPWLDELEKNGTLHPSTFHGMKFYSHQPGNH